MKVSAVVVSHGHAGELARSLPALTPQVDEVVVISNVPGSAEGVPDGVRVLDNPRPLSLAANVNLGIAATAGEYVLNVNPGRDRRARGGRSARRVRRRASTLWDRRPADALAGRELAAVPPKVSDRPRNHRAPDAAPAHPVAVRDAARALRARRAARPSPSRRTGCSAPSSSCAATLLDEIGGWDAGFRHYCEDIDLCYRAAQAGWERWYVPDAVVTHAYAAVIDQRFLSRHTLWHARGMARFVRKHPERLLAL